MKYILHFLNPASWIKAYFFANKNARFDKSTYDLELYLYSRILKNDMLHYGYFENINIKPEENSIAQLESAQIKYAENIINWIIDKKNPVLDVGCGMGGLSKMIHENNINVESLTPNKNQIEYINNKFPFLKTYHCKFEDFQSVKQFGTIINSESLQYIQLDVAFKKVEDLLIPGGRWIVADYFRLNNEGRNKSAHLLIDFYNKLKENNWEVIHEQNITLNVLPTIAYANMFAERFLSPLKHYTYEKFRYKSPKLFYMTQEIRNKLDKKIEKEQAGINPDQFAKEKQYMLFVLKNKIL